MTKAKSQIAKLLDANVPGWRKDVVCPVCHQKIHPGEVSRHLKLSHGIVKPDTQEGKARE